MRDAIVRIAVLLLFAAFPVGALGQDHRHPPQDEPLHERFYSTWYMPDEPHKSCCNKADCYPTEIKIVAGKIFAQRREDGKWLAIPDRKVERNRDNPDGRNHLCAAPPITVNDDRVFCFALGGGT